MNVKLIWSNFLNDIKTEVNSLAFDTWFKDTYLYDYVDKTCMIVVPMSIHKNHLSTKYYDLIVNLLKDVIGEEELEIEFYTQDEVDEFNNDNVIPIKTQMIAVTNKLAPVPTANLAPTIAVTTMIAPPEKSNLPYFSWKPIPRATKAI